MFRIAMAGVLAVASAAFAQTGVIVDPDTGEVVPVEGVKDLAAVEPRIPLTPPGEDGPFPVIPGALLVINTPGSYFLTSNLNAGAGFSGVDIQTSNVSLDLSGYSMVGLTGSVHAITSSTGGTNIRIFNGTIRGWDGNGIDGKKINSAQIDNVLVANCDGQGIEISRGVVRDCQVRLCLGSGITAVTGMSMVKDCRVEDCGLQGIDCGEQSVVTGCSSTGSGANGFRVGRGSTVEDCTGSQNALDGIVTLNHGTIRGCAAFNNGSDGIRCGNNSSVSGCEASLNVENGILAADNCTISDCIGNLNTLDGIHGGNGVALEGCTANGNQANGIVISGKGVVRGCSANSNGADGIKATTAASISECMVGDNVGNGIYAYSQSVVQGCAVSANGIDGIAVNYACVVAGNTVRGSTGYGINAGADNCVRDNTCDSNADAGIRIYDADTRVDNNHLTDDDMVIDGISVVVVRNTFDSLTENGSGNQIATVQTDVNNMGPWDNLAY